MKNRKKAVGKLCVNPKLPFDFRDLTLPHGTRLCFKGTSPDGCLIFEYEMPEVDDEKMVEAIRMSLMITMSDGVLHPGCDITIDQAFAWLDEKKADTTVLPELRESEDERIRKLLVEKISNLACGCFISQEQKQKFIHYLEKQKEQKSDAKSERVIKAARRVLNNWLDGTDCPDVSGDFAELEYAIREYDGEEKQKEQRPAEWSEEDEKNLELVTDCIYEFYPDPVMKYKLKDWLNSLRSRPKSSDNWKPSDEQMIALYNMIPFVKLECAPLEAVKPLESLYEDLKKL